MKTSARLSIIALVLALAAPRPATAQTDSTTSTSIGQDTEVRYNQTNSQGALQGPWRKFHANGKVAYEATFLNGRPVGKYVIYHTNGKPQSILDYDDQSLHASALFFNERGDTLAKGKYYGQLKDGQWRYYSYSRGLIEDFCDANGYRYPNIFRYLTHIQTYHQGKKEGEFATYYPDGSVAERKTFVNDVENGIWQSYNVNGSPRMEVRVVNGKLDGPCRMYYFNESPQRGNKFYMIGTYAQNLRHGTWTVYNEDGSVKETIEYVLGVATNNDELLEREAEWFRQMHENVGKIPEPSTQFNNDDFYNGGGGQGGGNGGGGGIFGEEGY